MKKIKHFIVVKSIGFYINLVSFISINRAKIIAYTLFSNPRKGKINPQKLPKTLTSAIQETFYYQNENFQTYTWKGNDEIILLVHGWESNSSRWKKLLYHLKPTGKTIIAIDAPAHGLSSGKEFNAPKYAEYIHLVSLKYTPNYVIGHSIGGAALSYYLHRFENNSIQKVVLLGSPSDFKIVSNNYVSLLSLNKKVQKSLEDYFYQRFNINIDEFKGHFFAQNFTQKALIAHDVDDNVVLIDEGKKYASTWKNAQFIETKGLGHSMHDANLYTKIIDFLHSKY